MLKNLIKISLRNLLHEKGYSTINILGLSLGITCSLFLSLYILDELSYDRYHKNADEIYRVISHFKETDNEFTWPIAQIPLRDRLQGNYSEVVNAVRFFDIGRNLYRYEEKSFYEEGFYLADSNVFDMFSYEFINGDPNTALDKPNTIVLSESTAMKYFGTTDCLTKSLADKENELFEITGVIKDVPLNSQLRFEGLISRSTIPGYQGSWGNLGIFTYIQFPKGYNADKFQKTLDDIIEEHVTPIFEPLGLVMKYELQQLPTIHLYSEIPGEDEGGGSILYVYIFSAIAVFMLIIAAINYMNLTTARSFRRAKEVGIRKVMGSFRGQLITQFITESVLVTLIAMLVSLLCIYLLLPVFNQIAQKDIDFSQLFELKLVGILLGIMLFIGFLAGSYPAFYLSKFKPAQVLKGRLVTKGGNTTIRKALVITQFSISIFMLISTLVVNDQLQYLMNKELGFNKEQVLMLELPDDDLRENFAALRNSLLQIPDVKHVSTSSSSPGNNKGVNKVIFQVESNEGEMLEKGVNFFSADFDFVSTLGMSIVEGRDFSRDIISDTVAAVLVNESMVERMNWQDPLGKKFIIPFGDTTVTKLVVGVIKDYHQNSLYNEISPIMIFYAEENYFSLVKLNNNNIPETIASIEKEWNTMFPNEPFEYKFMDQDFNAQYATDEKRKTIFSIFSAITIVIASLGLLGLTSFTTEQRTKEIGIRKVLGANAMGIVFLVSKEFFTLVLIATIIALPVAYYFMSSWLEAFVYKININSEVFTFILSAVLALLITLLTVGYHTTKAALANPVDSLKDE